MTDDSPSPTRRTILGAIAVGALSMAGGCYLVVTDGDDGDGDVAGDQNETANETEPTPSPNETEPNTTDPDLNTSDPDDC